MSEDVYLSQVNIVVSDMDASAAFYARLGVHLTDGGMPEWAPHHRSTDEAATESAHVDLDSVVFASDWNRGWQGGAGVVLTFRVPTRDDVDRLHRELTDAGHASQQGPYDAFWGARFAIVADPDGNAVGLMSPSDPTRRSAPTLPAAQLDS